MCNSLGGIQGSAMIENRFRNMWLALLSILSEIPENLRYEDNPRDGYPDSGNPRDIAGTGLSVMGSIILTYFPMFEIRD